MTIQFNEEAVKVAFRSSVQRMLSTEKGLTSGALNELDHLLEELMPLVIQQTQALVAAHDPAVAATYLKVIDGAVQATIARLTLRALAVQRKMIADLLASGVQIMAAVLKAAIVAP